MTEKEKMAAGMLYDANGDPQLLADRKKCKILCHAYNNILPDDEDGRQRVMRQILGVTGKNFLIEAPFYCDYGYNIEIGENFYANYQLVILDAGRVSFGKNVFVGPNCAIYTALHPLDAETRNRGLETAKAVRVGNDVWLGGNVTILPGVTIGDNCVIGAGSVVTRDIPSGVLAFGNPCRVIKKIDETD